VVITNGDNLSTTVDFAGATTVQDVLNVLNGAGVAVLARINDAGTGIDVINRLSGCQMRIGENGGTAAEELGIRSLHGDTLLSALNGGRGIETMEGVPDFRVHLTDGSQFDVDVSSATTLQDVVDLINAAAAAAGLAVGPVPPNDFEAGMADSGNGIQLTDGLGAGQLSIEKLNLSPAIDGLGLLGKTASGPGPVSLVSDDTNPVECEGVFGALCLLRDGLNSGDRQAVSVAGERLGDLIAEVNRWQGVVGAQSQAMSARLTRTEDAVDATRIMLSDLKDVDFTEAVTRFQQAQTALQANLMASSNMMNLSLLNFLR
jgi:flagellar hook-associated protein 3 FlgL